jgi:hypothetical protein
VTRGGKGGRNGEGGRVAEETMESELERNPVVTPTHAPPTRTRSCHPPPRGPPAKQVPPPGAGWQTRVGNTPASQPASGGRWGVHLLIFLCSFCYNMKPGL